MSTCDTCGSKCDYRSIQCKRCQRAREFEAAEWMERGACVDYPVDWWFPRSDAHTAAVERAKKICDTCVVKSSCAEYALKFERYGIWAGMTEKERRIERKQRREGAA